MTSVVVVDTNVASLIFKQQQGAEGYLRFMDGKECVLSFMSLAELSRWPIAKQWGAFRRTKLEKYLESYSISFCNNELCLILGEVMEKTERSGMPIGVADAWIAATAIYLGVPLLTHNPRHFAGVKDLEIISYA